MKFLKNAAAIVVAIFMLVMPAGAEDEKKYIKWVDFGVTAQALADAATLDIKSYESGSRADWVSALAHLGAKYGGDFSRYKKSDLKAAFEKLSADPAAFDDEKYYPYYKQAYGAVISGWLGEYYVRDGEKLTKKYGICLLYTSPSPRDTT